MVTKKITLTNGSGFHMRPAAGGGVAARLFPRDKNTFGYLNLDGDAITTINPTGNLKDLEQHG